MAMAYAGHGEKALSLEAVGNLSLGAGVDGRTTYLRAVNLDLAPATVDVSIAGANDTCAATVDVLAAPADGWSGFDGPAIAPARSNASCAVVDGAARVSVVAPARSFVVVGVT